MFDQIAKVDAKGVHLCVIN